MIKSIKQAEAALDMKILRATVTRDDGKVVQYKVRRKGEREKVNGKIQIPVVIGFNTLAWLTASNLSDFVILNEALVEGKS
jgi:hypothetical protein